MKPNRKNLFLAASAVLSVAFTAPSLHADSGSWNVDAAGNWSTAANWNPAAVPGTAAGDTINLTNNISTATRTVTIDTTSRIAGILNIGDSNNTNAFTLARTSTATLTLNNSGSDAQINVTGGQLNTISAPLVLADNLAVASTGVLLVSGGITESGAKTLTKTGLGTLSLSGTSSYTGGSTVSAGALSFRTTAAVPTTGIHAFGANAILGLGTGTGGFTIAQVNAALLGTAPAVGTITLNAGTKIGVDTGAATFDYNVALAASTRGFVKLGANTLTLSVDNSAYTGNISADFGTLAITHNNALGSVGSTTTTINGSAGSTGTALGLTATSVTIAEDIILKGNAQGRATISNSSAGIHTFTGAIDVSNDTNLSQISSGSTGSITFTGDVTGTITGGTSAGFLLRGTSTAAANSLTGNIALTGAGLVKTDTGTWLIGSAGKTYSSTLNVIASANGILKMGVADYLTGAPTLILGNTTGGSTGTIDLNGFNQTVGGISYNGVGVATGTRTITSGTAATLTVNNAIDSPSLGTNVSTNNVVLTGSLGLTKQGAGTLVLPGVNTHTGATLVSAGTLYVTGSLTASAVTVGVNGTIGRNDTTAAKGLLGNGLTIQSGGALDLTGATVALNSTGILSITGGNLTLGNLAFTDLIGWDFANADIGTYELIDGSFTVDFGSTAFISEATAFSFGNGKSGYFTSGSLNAVIIPEPNVAALIGAFGGILLLRRRR